MENNDKKTEELRTNLVNIFNAGAEELKVSSRARDIEYLEAINENKKNHNLAAAREKSKKKRYVNVYYNEKKLFRCELKKLLLATGVVLVAATAVISISPKVVETIDHQIEVKNIITSESVEFGTILAKNDLNVVPQNANQEWLNDYHNMSYMTEDDLYGAYKYFGYSETEKIIKEKFGYTGWNNYLSMNGYFDENGKPSIDVWENYMESKLIAEHKQGEKNGKSY